MRYEFFFSTVSVQYIVRSSLIRSNSFRLFDFKLFVGPRSPSQEFSLFMGFSHPSSVSDRSRLLLVMVIVIPTWYADRHTTNDTGSSRVKEYRILRPRKSYG